MKNFVPFTGLKILKMILPKEEKEALLGDFEEMYYVYSTEKGRVFAWLWCWFQVFRLIPASLFYSVSWSVIMFKNYLKTTFRNIVKQKLNSFVNITGLSLGLACSLLILFHIKDELSYEKNFPKSERIFRITSEVIDGETYKPWAVVSPSHAEFLKKDFPEIENAVRFRRIQPDVFAYYPKTGLPRIFEEKDGMFTDQEAVSVFDLNFIKGNPDKALTEVNSIVLTETVARKYFAFENPIGKTIKGVDEVLKVTGIIEDIPANTHLQFNFLVTMETLKNKITRLRQEAIYNSRLWAGVYTYILFKENVSAAVVESRLPDFNADFLKEFGPPEIIAKNRKLHLQPVRDIHLHSKLVEEIGPNSNIIYIYSFTAIGIFILLIAAVNFINISTAHALKRMNEIGIRKVLGARKSQLLRQYLGESFIFTFLASAAAALILYFTIPYYNSLSGKFFSFSQFFSLGNSIIILTLITLLGMLSGLYPAFFVSNFKPANAFRESKNPGSSAARLRKALVIFQFAISVFMIFCTIVVARQTSFFNKKDLGFDKDRVLVVKLQGNLRNLAVKNPAVLKTELKNNAAVLNVSIVSSIPGDHFSVEPIIPEGKPEDERLPQMRVLRADTDIVETLGLRMIEGKTFKDISPRRPAFLVNESASKALKLTNPVGRTVSTYFRAKGEITGVVYDFNYTSLHSFVEPLVIVHNPDEIIRDLVIGYMFIKIKGGNIPDILTSIKEIIQKTAPGSLFVYSFLESELNQLYISEIRMNRLFTAFSLFAIFISCLGLYGLSSFTAELKVKETGIRKVLGAPVSNLVFQLSKNFIVWVILANVFALPAAWIVMENWLQNFAYKIDIGPGTMLLSFLTVLTISVITVSWQALKAAYANPVDSLRNE